jgi:hypothetical protein
MFPAGEKAGRQEPSDNMQGQPAPPPRQGLVVDVLTNYPVC